jgi:hypothetical protein
MHKEPDDLIEQRIRRRVGRRVSYTGYTLFSVVMFLIMLTYQYAPDYTEAIVVGIAWLLVSTWFVYQELVERSLRRELSRAHPPHGLDHLPPAGEPLPDVDLRNYEYVEILVARRVRRRWFWSALYTVYTAASIIFIVPLVIWLPVTWWLYRRQVRREISHLYRAYETPQPQAQPAADPRHRKAREDLVAREARLAAEGLLDEGWVPLDEAYDDNRPPRKRRER